MTGRRYYGCRLLAALVTSCRDSKVKDGPGWYRIHRRHNQISGKMLRRRGSEIFLFWWHIFLDVCRLCCGIKHSRQKHWYIFTHFDTFSVIYDHIYDDDKYSHSLYRLLEFVQTNFYRQSCRHSKQGATSPGSWWWCFRADWYLTILLTIYRLSPDMETSVTNHITKHISPGTGAEKVFTW